MLKEGLAILRKEDLQPFSSVITENNEVGIVIRFNDTDILCFRKCVILLSTYNDDLTLKDRTSLDMSTEDDTILNYYENLMNISDYYNYKIVGNYEVDNFNLLYKTFNFNFLEKQIFAL